MFIPQAPCCSPTSGNCLVLLTFAAACTRTCFGVVETSCTLVSVKLNWGLRDRIWETQQLWNVTHPLRITLRGKAHDLLMVMLLFFHRFQTVIHLAMRNRVPVLCGKNNQNIVQHVAWVFLLHSTWESNSVHIWALVWGLGYRLWVWQSIDMLDLHIG